MKAFKKFCPLLKKSFSTTAKASECNYYFNLILLLNV